MCTAKLVRVFCALLIYIAPSGNAWAQEPSYSETKNYIIDRLGHGPQSSFFGNSDDRYRSLVVSTHSNCILELQTFSFRDKVSKPNFLDAKRINVSAILPDSLTGIFMPHTENRDRLYKIQFGYNLDAKYLTSVWNAETRSWKDSSSFLKGTGQAVEEIHRWGNDSDYYGPKVIAALRHFAALCGAKKELF